jgi:hypothetical protein
MFDSTWQIEDLLWWAWLLLGLLLLGLSLMILRELPRPWWSYLLCFLGCHDWREMDGFCRDCGAEDKILNRAIQEAFSQLEETNENDRKDDASSISRS